MVDVAFDEKRRTAAMMQKVSEVVVANNANAAHNIMDKIIPQNGHSQPNYEDLNHQVAHPESGTCLDGMEFLKIWTRIEIEAQNSFKIGI